MAASEAHQLEQVAVGTGNEIANSLVDRILGIASAVGGGTIENVTETNATFSYDETSAAEQDAIELTLSSRTVIGSIWLDMALVTRDTTIRVYHKINGSDYRLFQENSWVTADDDGVMITGFTARDDVKVTMQCDGAGAGSVNVPTSVV